MPSEQNKSITLSPVGYWLEHAIDTVEQHWLSVFLWLALIYTLLPFVAPLAMYAGFETIGQVIYTAYSVFCHQLPQRSWFFFGDSFTYTLPELQSHYASASAWDMRHFVGNSELGWKVAWSDRMVSLYTSFPIFGLIYKKFRFRFQLSWQWLLLCLLPLALDGLTHTWNDAFYGISANGPRDTNLWLMQLTNNDWPTFYAGDHFGTFNWWARLVSGLTASFGIIAFTIPRLQHQNLGASSNETFS